MSRLHSTTTAVLTAILLALSVGLMVQYASVKPDLARVGTATAAAADAQPAAAGTASSGPAGTMAAKPVVWAASAPGRIEPRGGEIRIGTQVPGRIAEVLVQLNDRVTAGDLMVRIDDEEAQAKMMAAEAEAAVRKRERDAETVGRLAQDRRSRCVAILTGRSPTVARAPQLKMMSSKRAPP
jgi:HlyD family secretion protein